MSAAGAAGEDPLADVARLSEAILKHVDFDAVSQDDFQSLMDSLYELAAVWTNPRATGPSIRSAIRLGYYGAADAKRAAPREPQGVDVP